MNCRDAKPMLSPYLDGIMDIKEARDLSAHLDSCSDCAAEFDSLRKTQSLVAALGRKPAPSNLARNIQMAVVHERLARRNFSGRLQAYAVRIENVFNSFMLPATAGLFSAVIIFGLLIGFFALPSIASSNDVPTMLYVPPRLSSSSFPVGFGQPGTDSPVVLEAYVDAAGRVQDYRIISGTDNQQTRRQLDNALIFAQFEPAMSFGQPAPGKILLSFSRINVGG